MTKKICKKLRNLSSDEDSKRLFEWFANAGQHRDKTTVDRLEKQTGVGRRQVITFLKELNSIGVGKFVVGRRGYPSRIVLQYERSEIGAAGLGSIKDIEPRYDDDEDETCALQNDEHVKAILKSFEITISKVLKCEPKAVSISYSRIYAG